MGYIYRINKYALGILMLWLLTSCHVGRFFYYNFADIKDYEKFPQAELEKSNEPYSYVKQERTLIFPDSISTNHFEHLLEATGTVAFLVIKEDTIVYETYLGKYNSESIIPSFSVAKSFVSALLGIAIDEGYIQSVNEPITNYIPFKDSLALNVVTIKDVLDMRSGLNFSESYINPFADVAKYYYGRNTNKYLMKIKAGEEPGKDFHYISANTQILSLIIEKATGRDYLDYFNEKLWQPLHPEYNASWNMDSKKHANYKTFCCLNARPRDFAKFGSLFLHNGLWEGKQVVPTSWIRESTEFREEKNFYIYSYQWWHTADIESEEQSGMMQIQDLFDVIRGKTEDSTLIFQPYPDYFAQGILGQYIYVHPASKTVIVRMGKKGGGLYWAEYLRKIAEINHGPK